MQQQYPQTLRTADAAIIGMTGMATVLAGSAFGFDFPTHALALLPIAVATYAMNLRLTAKRELPLIACLFALSTWIIATGPIMITASYVFPALNFPLIDPSLAAADDAIGFHAPTVVEVTGRIPWLASASLFAYSHTGHVLVLGFAILLVARDYQRISKVLSLLTLSMVITLVLSTAWPAMGAFAHYGISSADLGALAKSGVGTWHVADLAAIRDGTLRVFPKTEWQGLVTFPSFHTMYVLTAAYALANNRWLRWPAQVFAGFVMFTTVPIGGHYFVDVIGGLAIYAGCLAWIENPRTSPFKSAAPTERGVEAPLPA